MTTIGVPNQGEHGEVNRVLATILAVLWAAQAAADFGDYVSHEQQAQSLLVNTDVEPAVTGVVEDDDVAV